MSTEPEGVASGSEAVNGSNTSRVEVGNDQIDVTLADPLSGQAQELVAKRDEDEKEGCIIVESGTGSLDSEKGNGFTDLEKQTESVNGELDLGIGTQNVGVETSEEVLVVKSGKYSDGIESHAAIVKGSDVTLESDDLVEDRKPDGSGKQGTEVEDLDVESFVCIEPHEIKDESDSDDDDNAPVTPKVKLSDSDLVWAKVRSHPWWPGQVFDVSAASDKAKKYSKKGSVLVTYFGDCSFAWNDASRIKPFRQHFSQMAKQSSLPDFVDAIDFALEEVSRRIEFGLACSCISEEVYQKIESQNIVNPGIREESSSIHGGDKVSSANFFEPANLVDYVKRLACSPSYDATDGLQFASQRAKLLAFNRWKGYTDLPEFETLQGSVESAPKTSPAEEKSSLLEVKVSVAEPKKTEQVYTKRKKREGQDDCKDDRVFEYEDTTVPKKKKEKKEEKAFEYEDSTVPKKKKGKKEKTLADFIAEVRLSRSNGKTSHEDSAIKPDSEKKRKIVHSKPRKSAKKIKANLQTEEDPGSPISPKNDGKHNSSAGDKTPPKRARASFGIGASIMKVANQMNCSTPMELLPCSNSTSRMAAKNKGSGKSLQKKPKAKAKSEREISPSPNEKLSSPHSASSTENPSGNPNSINIDHLQPEELDQVIKEAPSTDLVEDSKLESTKLKESSKEQMVDEVMKEAADIAGDITMKDSNLTEGSLI